MKKHEQNTPSIAVLAEQANLLRVIRANPLRHHLGDPGLKRDLRPQKNSTLPFASFTRYFCTARQPQIRCAQNWLAVLSALFKSGRERIVHFGGIEEFVLRDEDDFKVAGRNVLPYGFPQSLGILDDDVDALRIA